MSSVNCVPAMSSNGRSSVTSDREGLVGLRRSGLRERAASGGEGAVGEQQHPGLARVRAVGPEVERDQLGRSGRRHRAGPRAPVDQREVALAKRRKLHPEDLVGEATGEVSVHRQKVSGERRAEVLAGEADLLGADREHGVRAVRRVIGEEEDGVVVAIDL